MESDLLVALTELLKPLGNQQPHLIFSRVTLTQLLLSAFVSSRRDARLPGDRADTDIITGRKRASLEDFDFGKQKPPGQKKPQKTTSLDQSVLQAIAAKFQSFIEVMTTQEVEGLLQLVFIRQLNLCIETGFKTCGIVANTEMNEQLRSSFFGAYLDGFHVSHGLFILGQHLPQGSSIPTSEIFEKILLRRSSDSSAEVRLTATKLVHRILFSVPEDAPHKAQLRLRLFITVLLPRLLDVDSRVKNSAVRTSAKSLFMFKELAPILTKPETLAPLVQACLRTDNLSEEEITNIEYLCCALVFGVPDGPQNRSLDEKVAEQTHATLEDARRRISSKIKFEVKRHQAQAEVMIESLSHIVALLRDQAAEVEDHSKMSLILSRACIAFIKDTSCEEESIMELIFALYRIAIKTTDSQSGLAFRCIACLIREAPKSPNLLRGIGNTFSPQFVVSTLQLLGKEVSVSSFEPRIKTLQEFYSSFSVTRADLKEDGCALIEKALPVALNKFWSSEPKLMKCLSKFFVTLSQTMAKSDILSGLVSKSINFLLQVKNTLQERAKQTTGSRNKKNIVELPKIEDEQYVRPLRIAFYSIYLILSNSPVGALDKEVASYVADLCMDLLKVKDPEVFKYSLGSLYFLSLSQAAAQTNKVQKKSKLDEEEPAVQGFKPLVAQMTSAADPQEPYCIPGILFVSMLFVERKRTK